MAISIKDIAERAGVAPSTVTKALCGYRGVSERTRHRVQSAAYDLGYKPNALLSAWMSRVRKADRSELQSVLGVLVAVPFRSSWLDPQSKNAFRSGVYERCSKLGWTVDLLPYADVRELENQLRVAKSRGVQALLFTQVPESLECLKIDDRLLAPFSLMALGMSLKEPQIHRVSPDHYGVLRALMAAHIKPNMGPVGLIVDGEQDRRLNRVWSSSYRGWEFPTGTTTVPVFELGTDFDNDARRLLRWQDQYRCRAILSTHGRASRLLINSGLQDCTIIRVDEDSGGGLGSVSTRHAEVGEAAVEWMIGNLLRGELGIPESPRTVLVQGPTNLPLA
ncbi:MAG: LacI family DNA-binding transcriptional regulator [Opitutales bacterium]|nr:LacI family DNA-binding transcriptional regulator [Opitutales bacterium]